MAGGWYQPLVVVSILTLLPRWGEGEKFFQHRDHRDQKFFERHHHRLTVHNKLEAEEQLEKYGYLQCRVMRKKRSAGSFGLWPEGGAAMPGGGEFKLIEGDLRACSPTEVRNAIREYQKTYKLPPTGFIDRRTRKFMSTSRCGNADTEERTKPSDVPEVGEGKGVSSTNSLLKDFVNKNSNSPGGSNWGDQFKSHPWKRSASNSNLMKVIAGKDSVSSVERRRRYLHEYIDNLKNEDPMLYKGANDGEDEKLVSIKKRSVAVQEHISNSSLNRFLDGQRFEKQVIRWRLLETGYSTRIPVEDQRATIDLAFRMWSEVIPLKFTEEPSGDIARVDIEVAFGKGAHQNCKRDFDGNGGEIAHSFSSGNMHFDDEENFKSLRSFTPDGIYLLRVAVHEIGHVLGLMHTNKKYSIMYAIYEKASSNPDFELGWEDRKAVQRVYGVCKGRFNTVFDWVRKRPDNQFIYNTYFFRGNHYWMYENHANRTRYGDPLYISREWGGIPNEVDGYAHVWYFSGSNVVDDAYFFKGEQVYKYNSELDVIYEGWPRLIREEYGPKPGENKSLPDNIDTAFFDMRDKNTYIFKDDMVYVYDPKEPVETRGCCVRIAKLQELFPAVEGSKPLPPNLDAVYYSYKDSAMYFLKDEEVWQNILFHPKKKHVKNSVKYLGNWFDKWFDICDVTTHSTHMFEFLNGAASHSNP